MGYLDDIISLARDIGTSLPRDMMSTKTISKRAMDGTLFFPCLISDAIPINLASTICRTMEAVDASFLQTVFSLQSTINISTERNPVEYLKKFHRNTKLFEAVEIDDEMGTYIEGVSEGKFNAYITNDMKTMAVFNESDENISSLIKKFKEQSRPVLESYDIRCISDNKIYVEADEPLLYRGEILDKLASGATKSFQDLRTQDVRKAPQMLDTDVKKSNDMKPYQIEVKLMAVNDKDQFVEFMVIVVGVKDVLHPIKSNEMITNLVAAVSNNDILFNMIRWTTGEKSLMKDILLHIDDVKLDVANRSMGTNPQWLNLKRMKSSSSRQRALMSKNKFIPNTKVVVTRDEVDFITEKYGYDLSNNLFANKLMDALFLMAFIIVDDGSNTVKINYAGTGQGFNTYSLDVLEREVNNSTNKLGKELIKMVSR